MLEKLPEAVGHALRNQRAGLDQILCNRLDFRQGTGLIEVTSSAFVDHGPIPAAYTADGQGISPPLSWTLPAGRASSLVIVIEDADSPTPHPLVHAIVVDLAAATGELPEGALRSANHPGNGVKMGQNSYLLHSWLPPDPPPGHGVHRYAFQVFALADAPPLSEAPGREEIFKALTDHGVASGWLIGSYQRGARATEPLESSAAQVADA